MAAFAKGPSIGKISNDNLLTSSAMRLGVSGSP
jgi:hypothetical protein